MNRHTNLYFIRILRTKKAWFIGFRGRGFNEGGYKVWRDGWKIRVKRLTTARLEET